MRIQYFVGILCLFLTVESYAALIDLKVTDYDGLDSIPFVKQLIDVEVDKIEDDINAKIPNGAETRVMKGMSNSSVIAGKGVASDYSSNMEYVLVGAALGGGVDLEKPRGTDSDFSGVGVAPAVIIGGNMRAMGVYKFAGLDAKRVNAYANFAVYNYTHSFHGNSTGDSDINVDMKAAGFKLRYDWIQGKEYRHATWGGVKLHWGYEYNHSNFMFEHDLDKVISTDVSGLTLGGRITGRPKYEVDVITHSLPFEISTDVRIFKFLSFFGGAGFDINFGKAKGKARANGDASPIICTDNGAICGPGKIVTLKADASADAEANVDPLSARGFLGLQINVPYVQVYGIVDKAVGNQLLGVAVGIRYVH